MCPVRFVTYLSNQSTLLTPLKVIDKMGTKMKFLAIFLILIGRAGTLYWLKGHTAPQLIGKAYFSIKTDKKL
jgi:hypothetical protein